MTLIWWLVRLGMSLLTTKPRRHSSPAATSGGTGLKCVSVLVSVLLEPSVRPRSLVSAFWSKLPLTTKLQRVTKRRCHTKGQLTQRILRSIDNKFHVPWSNNVNPSLRLQVGNVNLQWISGTAARPWTWSSATRSLSTCSVMLDMFLMIRKPDKCLRRATSLLWLQQISFWHPTVTRASRTLQVFYVKVGTSFLGFWGGTFCF